MERLTFEGNFCDICVCMENPCKYPGTGCSQRQVWERLKAYEDTGLMPEDMKRIFNEDAIMNLAAKVLEVSEDRLRELVQADKEGRCLVLPEKVWDMANNRTRELVQADKEGRCLVLPEKAWDMANNRTREEAQTALDRREKDA